MGWRYVSFRTRFEIFKRLGLLKPKYPQSPNFQTFISLNDWRQSSARFFFEEKSKLTFPKVKSESLKEKVDQLKQGNFPFFNAAYRNIGLEYDWMTNPDSGFTYDPSTHWLDIEDYSLTKGDIKFVWEKSRFSYLMTIIRYDYHFDEDCSEWVFSEIDSWINSNPINSGPNFKCSQEISLRMLNWLFALYYYKQSAALSSERFDRIMHYCYWQLHHVRHNINFSRIAVRNNHAITETMMLFLGGIFFPFFPEAQKWSAEGLKWLEEEVAYQVYKDGTFLQFSHNYNRVLVQLLTWSLYLSDLNEIKLSETFLSRSKSTFNYLYQCQIVENGQLPNYGANDGALFFPLNDCDYRDYRPQLNALAYYFKRSDLYTDGPWIEDRYWYTASNHLSNNVRDSSPHSKRERLVSFEDGGYYIQRDRDCLTFIRCGNHKDRPSHADNLHVDIWVKGKNIIRDSGTYKYNTSPEELRYFMGTKGHNTVMLGGMNQMEKGARFIWLNWTQAEHAMLIQESDCICFEGSIKAFQHIQKGIVHSRKLIKKVDKLEWKVIDTLEHRTDLPMQQVWNLHPDFFTDFNIEAIDEGGELIPIQKKVHWYSSEYGVKEKSLAVIFETKSTKIITIIKSI